MDKQKLEILYEDNHLLVVNKPALLPTMGVAADDDSLVTRAKEYIRRRYNKPGNVYLGVVSRLDMMCSGVLVLARTSKAAARLSDQFRERTIDKVYWAVVPGPVEPMPTQCEDWVTKDETRRRMVVVASDWPGAKVARLSYRRLANLDENCLIEVRLETGRKHQIRLQLSERGHAVLGDRKYDSRESFSRGIALHARELTFEHPTRREPVQLQAPLPAAWRAFGVRG